MAELLKLPQLAQRHCVPQMQIRSRRINAELHPQRRPIPGRRTFDGTTQIVLRHDLRGSAEQNPQLLGGWNVHRHGPANRSEDRAIRERRCSC